MDMITSDDVIRRIETYFRGGVCQYLKPEQATLVEGFVCGYKTNAQVVSTVSLERLTPATYS